MYRGSFGLGKGITVALLLTVGASPAVADATARDRQEALPPLPGAEPDRQDDARTPEQTPPSQEDVIPGTPGGETLDPEARPGQVLPGNPNQPAFDRDATPRSTAPERAREAEPYGAPATGDTPQTQVPRDERPGERAPDTEAPGDGEALPEEPIGPPDPDEIPDRRFETFETRADDFDGGTPALTPPPQPIDQAGTPPL